MAHRTSNLLETGNDDEDSSLDSPMITLCSLNDSDLSLSVRVMTSFKAELYTAHRLNVSVFRDVIMSHGFQGKGRAPPSNVTWCRDAPVSHLFTKGSQTSMSCRPHKCTSRTLCRIRELRSTTPRQYDTVRWGPEDAHMTRLKRKRRVAMKNIELMRDAFLYEAVVGGRNDTIRSQVSTANAEIDGPGYDKQYAESGCKPSVHTHGIRTLSVSYVS